MVYFLRYVFVFILLSLSSAKAGKVEMDVYHAGQGNCVLMKFTPNGEDPAQVKHMLVDVGSSSYKEEMAWMRELMARDERYAGKSSSSGGMLSSPSVEGSSREEEYEIGGEGGGEEEVDNFLIQKLRKKLEKKEKTTRSARRGRGKQKKPISIHTVVITHPDKDHYGWLKTLFSEDADHIEHVIFGGLPEHYDVSGTLMLSNWIRRHISLDTKIYFPAISYEPITSFEDVLPSAERTYAPHRYSTPDSKIEEFEEAFNFGPDINVDLLSVNPSHFQGRGETNLRMSDDPGDDNADSLVLRVGYGGSSIILTGDATNRTTTRIIDNYSTNDGERNFLKTNVLLASHHGSSSHGSNNEAWIDATQPEVILISNGLSQGHPHEEAYQAFKESQRLKKAIPRGKTRGSKKHEVHTPEGRREKTYLKHRTKRAIFSTVTSFDIKIVLHEDGTLGLETERGGVFDLMDLTEAERHQKDKVVEGKPGKLEGKIVLIDTPEKEKGENEAEEAAGTRMDVVPPTPQKEETKAKDSAAVVNATVAGGKVKRSLKKKRKKKSKKKKETAGIPMEVDGHVSSKEETKAEGKQTPKTEKKNKKSKTRKSSPQTARKKGKAKKARPKKAKAASEGKTLAKGKKRKTEGDAKTAQGVAEARKRQRTS